MWGSPAADLLCIRGSTHACRYSNIHTCKFFPPPVIAGSRNMALNVTEPYYNNNNNNNNNIQTKVCVWQVKPCSMFISRQRSSRSARISTKVKKELQCLTVLNKPYILKLIVKSVTPDQTVRMSKLVEGILFRLCITVACLINICGWWEDGVTPTDKEKYSQYGILLQ